MTSLKILIIEVLFLFQLVLALSPYRHKAGDCGELVLRAVEISDGTRDRVTLGEHLSVNVLLRAGRKSMSYSPGIIQAS